MILADMPESRYICPVTIFLSLAIADCAIDGVHSYSDFLSLVNPEWLGRVSLPFRADVRNLSVLRRTGNKSKAISSCPMKPYQIQKMIQAQIARAGHKITFASFMQDARMSAQRHKRRK
jgi:hypothetical protein